MVCVNTPHHYTTEPPAKLLWLMWSHLVDYMALDVSDLSTTTNSRFFLPFYNTETDHEMKLSQHIKFALYVINKSEESMQVM